MIQILDYRTMWLWFCVLLLQRILPKSLLLGHDRGEFQCYLLYRDHLSSITKPHGLPCGSNLDRSEVYKWFFEAQSIPQASFFIASSSVTQLRWVSTCRTRILYNLLFLSRLVSHSVEATSARSHPSRFLFGCKSTSLPVCALLHHSSFMFWLWLCF